MERKKARRKASKDGLYLRSKTWWTRIDGERISTGCQDREAARIARARLEREAADPANDASRRTTVADMIGEVLADRARAKGKHGALITAETIGIYQTKLGHVARILGAATPLYEINYDAVGLYIRTRSLEPGAGADRVSQHTIHKELSALRFGLRLMQENGKYPHRIDHVTRVRRFAVGYKPRKRHLTWEEIPKLISALLQEQKHRVPTETLRRAKELREEGRTLPEIAEMMGVSLSSAKRYVDMEEPEPTNGALVRAQHAAWYIATGGRDEESHRAEMRDNDLAAWSVFLRGTKTGEAERTVPIAPCFRSLLVFALEGRPKRGPLFPRWENVNRSLYLACTRAGIERVSPNDLRRTHASLLRQAGIALEDIAPVLGHTSTRMLESVYGRTNLQALSKAVEKAVEVPNLVPPRSTNEAQRTRTASKSRRKPA